MPNVKKFVLDGTAIDIEDATARAESSSAIASIATLTSEVNEIKKLSRLTVSYTESESTITFTTESHD